jgi:exopolyphosphatase/guanosine-5'-triphosphate,3'-diphosphate pyrophosphatase
LVGVKEKAPLKLKAINQLYDSLAPLTLGQRMDQFGLKPDRADVIVPALEIFRFCMDNMNCDELLVPKIGLSDGMVVDMDGRM